MIRGGSEYFSPPSSRIANCACCSARSRQRVPLTLAGPQGSSRIIQIAYGVRSTEQRLTWVIYSHYPAVLAGDTPYVIDILSYGVLRTGTVRGCNWVKVLCAW